ncbi:hypothetical protein [Pseudolactococcus insecticola]|nr:hypothetical protein [Lactococcus insecticola]
MANELTQLANVITPEVFNSRRYTVNIVLATLYFKRKAFVRAFF